MPWTGKEFASKHNHSLTGAKASKAAAQATAMVKAGVPEGEAIATANKRAKSRDGHMAAKAKHQTQKEVAKDFGKSQSTVSRGIMRHGFVQNGSAK